MKNKFICFIFIFFIYQIGFSQTVSRMEVFMQVDPSDTTNLFGDTLFQSNTKLLGTMVLSVSDTIGIASLSVKVGTSSGSGNLFQKTFTFDTSGNFNDGTSYIRKGYIIHLGINGFTGVNNFYSKVDLINSAGNIISTGTFDMN